MKLNYASFINTIYFSLGEKYEKMKLHNDLMEIIKNVYITELNYTELDVKTINSAQITWFFDGTRDIQKKIKEMCYRITDITQISEELKETVLCALPPENGLSLRRDIIRIVKDDISVKNINSEAKSDFLARAQDIQLEELIASVFLHVIKYTKNSPYWKILCPLPGTSAARTA